MTKQYLIKIYNKEGLLKEVESNYPVTYIKVNGLIIYIKKTVKK